MTSLKPSTIALPRLLLLLFLLGPLGGCHALLIPIAIPIVVAREISELGDSQADREESEALFKEALTRARCGDFQSQLSVAHKYRLGDRTDVDRRQAYKWYTIVISNGDSYQGQPEDLPPTKKKMKESAKEMRDDVASDMTSDDVGAAQHLALCWRPEICDTDSSMATKSGTSNQGQAAEQTSDAPPQPEFRDEYALTRKVVCEVPGEGRKTLIYANCLYHDGRVIAEVTPNSPDTIRRAKVSSEITFPVRSRALGTEFRCATPMPKPEVTLGEKWIGLRNGKSLSIEVVSIDHWGSVTKLGSNGCRFREKAWDFAPTLGWSGCSPYADGGHNIRATSGELWPLRVGNRIKYKYDGPGLNGKLRSGTRTCEVKSWENVSIGTGLEETFKIVCDDRLAELTYYVSPRLKAVVSLTVFRKRHNHTIRYELTRVHRPVEEPEAALGDADTNAERRRFIELERWIEQNENEFQHRVKGFRNAVKPKSHGSDLGPPHANY